MQELVADFVVVGAGWSVNDLLPCFERSERPEVATDDALLDFARLNGSTVFHPTSTCQMGTDWLSVIDADLLRQASGQRL